MTKYEIAKLLPNDKIKFKSKTLEKTFCLKNKIYNVEPGWKAECLKSTNPNTLLGLDCYLYEYMLESDSYNIYYDTLLYKLLYE